ncbi:MAG: hypothetical protein U9R19_05110, partial [Bacteroidota bacterium]|nr:hypothetical protein [Bacteroidota bacterium]
MGFPATKTVKNNFELADDVNPKQVTIINTFFDRLQNYNLEKLEKETDSISFISRNSLFKIPYAIKLSFAIKKKLEITYHINMMELLKSCVIVAIIAAFFSSMSIERFIILFVLLVSGFYVFNVFVIENGLKRTINEVFKKTSFAEKDTTISEQHSWMSDTSRC